MKVTVIEEAQNIASLKVDELFKSLLMFEMSLDRKPEKKSKSIALQYVGESLKEGSNKETDESFAESIALLSKQFNEVLKRFGKKSGGKTFGHNGSKPFKVVNHKKDGGKPVNVYSQKEKNL